MSSRELEREDLRADMDCKDDERATNVVANLGEVTSLLTTGLRGELNRGSSKRDRMGLRGSSVYSAHVRFLPQRRGAAEMVGQR